LKRLLPHTLRGELIGVMLIASIVPLLVYVALSAALAWRGVSAAEHKQALAYKPAVLAIIDQVRKEQLREIQDYAQWGEARRAVLCGDGVWLLESVTGWIPEHFDLAAAGVFDLAGRPLATDDPYTPQVAAALPPLLGAAAPGLRQDLRLMDGRLMIVTTAPITDDEGERPAGLLVCVKAIDAALMRQIASFTGASAVLLHAGEQLTASSEQETGDSPRPVVPGADRSSVLTTRDYVGVQVPLQGASGRILATVQVLEPRAAWRATTNALILALAVGLVFTLMATVTAAPLAAGRLRGRLDRVTETVRALAAGETCDRLEVSGDEIGAVKDAVNAMSAHVEETIADLNARLQALASQLAELASVGETLTGHSDIRKDLDSISALLRDAFRADAAGMFLRDDAGEVSVFAAAGESAGQRLVLREAALAAMRERRPALLPPAELAPRTQASCDTEEALESIIVAPLLTEDRILGALAVGSQLPGRFTDLDLLVLSTVAGQVTIALRNATVIARLEATNLETVRALAAAMETKDHYTAEHAESLALMAIAVGRELGLSDADLRLLEYASLLHDIGKIGVPGEILNKPDQLTDEEFAEIAKHTLLGEHISSQVDDLKPVARIIRSAHERWDGKGYPDGLSGEQIPLLARILLVCDAFDAMTSHRPYRKAMPAETALIEIRAWAGQQFDPGVVQALCHVWESIGRLRSGGTPAMPIYIWNRPRGPEPQPGTPK